MTTFLVTICLTNFCLVQSQNSTQAPFGYLWQPAFEVDTVRRPPGMVYEPQVGDIVLFNHKAAYWQALFRLALSGPPTHSAIVVGFPDGKFGLIEAGFHEGLSVELPYLSYRLADYEENSGTVYVRRRKTPLTAEQSEALTQFALAVEKKRIPVARFAAQVTPFRSRGPLRSIVLAKPQGVKDTYTCSELVVEALVTTGLIPENSARPAATFPRDLFFDTSANVFLNRHFRLEYGWHPPSLWTSSPLEIK